MRTYGQEPEPMPPPRTMSFCKTCGKHTPHEWREGDRVVAKICVDCVERADLYALEGD
jgi:hypothetical protein